MRSTTPGARDDCIFCKIVRGRVPSTVVYEDEDTLAFLDVAPATDGHTLVVPKTHADDLLVVSQDVLGAVARATQSVARFLDERLTPGGLTIFQANREAGWQDVFHLHFHVVPRWENDSLQLPWSSVPAAQSEIAGVAARLGLSSESR